MVLPNTFIKNARMACKTAMSELNSPPPMLARALANSENAEDMVGAMTIVC